MKGTILDFLKLTAEKPELAKELVELATKYDFEFSDEESDEQLDDVAGGATLSSTPQQLPEPELNDPSTLLSDMAARAHTTLTSVIGNIRA